MRFKDFPGIRDVRFWFKTRYFFHRLPKRYPGYVWKDFEKVCVQFKGDNMGSLEERAFLFRLASDLPENARVIEIGSWLGVSTCYLSYPLKGEDAKTYAVDNFQGLSSAGSETEHYRNELKRLRDTSTRAGFDRNIGRLGLDKRVTVVEADSEAALEKIPCQEGSVDLLFIDGDHSFEGCLRDIGNWTRFVKEGGICLFHDFGSNIGVSQAIFEAIQEGHYRAVLGQAGTLLALKK